jgi:uncharacterized protein involved in exopolysaccharide biosynthesis
VNADADIAGESGEFAAKAPPRQARDTEGEITAEMINEGVQRMAGDSMAQIGRMIAALTQLRAHLRNEGERVQDEIARLDGQIAGYTQMSEAAQKSIRAIDQAVGKFKGVAKPNA